MSLHSAISTEVNRIRKSPDASRIQDVSYKELSDAAITRVEFWLKRIATFIYIKKPAIPSMHTEVPRRMNSLLKKYICPSDIQAQDTYYLFKEMITFLLRYYRPKNPRSTVLTVDCVDQSVFDPNGPLYEYLENLLAVRSLPYRADNKACDRRK